MQAVILAAGMGKRLKELTRNNTKCMVKVNGVTLIERMLKQIEAQNVSRIVIVVGYEGQKLIDFIHTLSIQTPVEFIENPVFDKTNNIYSLYLAKDVLCEEDTLLFESDLIFEDAVLDALVEDPRDTLALLSKYEPWMDGTCVTLKEDDSIDTFVPGKQFRFSECEHYYKTVNIYKFSQSFSANYYVPFLTAYQQALGQNEYYEQVLRVITMLEEPVIKGKRLDRQKGYEIDDIQDLDIAESIFSTGSTRRAKLMERYGGYWRYPNLLDYCYLVNPYFPNEKLKEELKYSFDALLTQYPSGMKVNSLVASRNFNVSPEQIVVGNGAAELIHSLMNLLEGTAGFIRPTFEEYPNRWSSEDAVVFTPELPDYAYTAEDLISYFSRHPVDHLILINPDNPSGNYIPSADLLRLVKWAEEKAMNLIVDESFADFAQEENNSLLSTECLSQYPHLFVMKSISKSYGVPGLRLGILASGNTEVIARMKKDVSIWNINSFGEYFLQIYAKYEKDYHKALQQFKAERTRLKEALRALPGLRVIDSEANFVMAEVTCMTSSELQSSLLDRYDILIKDLSGKLNGQSYIRLAIRDSKDNDRLLHALEELLK